MLRGSTYAGLAPSVHYRLPKPQTPQGVARTRVVCPLSGRGRVCCPLSRRIRFPRTSVPAVLPCVLLRVLDKARGWSTVLWSQSLSDSRPRGRPHSRDLGRCTPDTDEGAHTCARTPGGCDRDPASNARCRGTCYSGSLDSEPPCPSAGPCPPSLSLVPEPPAPTKNR